MVCVAVPISGTDGELIAALALSAPEARMTLDQACEHIPKLRDAAQKLSETFSTED